MKIPKDLFAPAPPKQKADEEKARLVGCLKEILRSEGDQSHPRSWVPYAREVVSSVCL